ncbi:MAG: VOC family protein [Rhodobacteraceae bacterium]|jgi:catechol 2,3-dioxygenase-like lactoylglutathione lyase family enzyme|nr:VOC family protein [Paracoccaceae bacterium]
MPTPSCFHHIGITVPDLEAAVRFMTEGMGCALAFTAPGRDPMTAEAAARINVAPGSRIAGMAMLRAGAGYVELFAFEHPGGARPAAPRWNEGGAHVAFAVDDLEAALARAVAAGGCALSGINRSESPGFAGMRWVYVVAPWGQTFELVDVRAAPGVALGA